MMVLFKLFPRHNSVFAEKHCFMQAVCSAVNDHNDLTVDLKESSNHVTKVAEVMVFHVILSHI